MSEDTISASPEGGAAQTGKMPDSRKAGFLERTVTRLFMRPARVVGTSDLSERFRLIDFQGEALKDCSWSPGDKVQIKLDGGFITRTYTPISWNKAEGTTQFLAYCHGTGPGSAWAKHVAIGDERQLFGPRGSLSLESLGPSTILFGDETSFALALALEGSTAGSTQRRYVFEVNDHEEAASVLGQSGLQAPMLVNRSADGGHLGDISDALLSHVQSASTVILCGKASSIQYVSRVLKANGVETRRLRTKAYWAPGKVGLD